MIVHLNGMPGVGKYTVAKRLRDILPARLIDNHLIIDLVEGICGGRTRDYARMLATITGIVYSLIVQTSADGIILFTNSLAKGLPEDEARLAAVKDLARRMQTLFVSILLTCEAAENERRLLMPDRSSKGKLMDARNLRELIAKYQIAHYPEHPNAFQIDTSMLTAEQAANKIVEHLKSCTALEG